MKLNEYLKKNNITQDEFAKSLGITQGFISQYTLGLVKMPALRALQIEKATNGMVTLDDLIEIPEVKEIK